MKTGMQDDRRWYAASVTIDQIDHAVRVAVASHFSIWVEFAQCVSSETVPKNVDTLSIRHNDSSIVCGKCRVLPPAVGQGDTATPPTYQLVPLNEIYNFETFFSEGRARLLEASIADLPLILGYKSSIDPQFKEYVSNVSYDLNVYKNYFDRIDDALASEPETVRATICAALIERYREELFRFFDKCITDLEVVVSKFSEPEHRRHGYYLRRQLWTILMCPPIIARTNLKPRGYIGDSEMMRMIYRNTVEGDTTFARIFHKFAVEQPAAQAVRNRRVQIARIVRDFLALRDTASGTRVRVLSVACGPAIELRDLINDREVADALHLSLLDQDEHALQEAASVVSEIEQTFEVTMSVDFIRESVRTLLFTEELRQRWGSFDLIYSLGLFDYLTPPVASAVLRKLYTLLEPGGEMIIGNFHVDNPTRHFMANWLDWTILHRTESDLVAIAEGLPGAGLSFERDETGIQIFLRIRRTE